MKTKLASLKPAALAAALGLLLAAPAAKAGLLETQSNPVNFGTNYWASPASWEALGIPKYTLDPAGDGSTGRDINFISIAHDDSYFYVRYSCNLAPKFGGDWNMWLDTDLNFDTGAHGWSGNGAVGSEFLVTGAALIQNPYAWIFRDWLNWDQTDWTDADLPREAIFSINRQTQLPGVTAFNFTCQLYGSGGNDWYPDAADTRNGDYFRYTTTPSPTMSSAAYQKLVRNDGPLAYYRLNETTAFVKDVATNGATLGSLGNGTYTIGAKHPVSGALAGDSDTAARFSAVDSITTDGGVPVIVPWLERPLIRELWDNVGIGVLDGQGSGTSTIGLDPGTPWHVNVGRLIKVAQDFDITNAPPSPPLSQGQKGGLWADDSDLGGLSHMWDTRSWATRPLTTAARINFGAAGDYWISVRIHNAGDTAMGVGLASGNDDSAAFVGVGAMWNTATGQDSLDAANSLYISSGTLGGGSGPYTIQAHSSAGLINGPGLILAHLITSPSGACTLDAAVYQPGETLPSDAASFSPQVSHAFTSTMLATHLLVWLNGDTSSGNGQLDAIRLTTSFADMFQGELRNTFSVEAWLRPTIEGAGNAQCPLFNRVSADPRQGWAFFQRASDTGWNFCLYGNNGGNVHNPVISITGGPYTIGAWCHLAATFDGSTATLYINGTAVGSQALGGATYAPNGSGALSVGGYSDASQNPFTGDLDEIAIYTNALTSGQVAAHYANGTNPSRTQPYSSLVLADGAIEYLRLDEPGRNIAANSGTLGTDADGVYDAYVVKGASGPLSKGFEAANTAAGFNRYNSYVELGAPAALNFSGQITLEAWVQPSIAPANRGDYGNIIAHGYDEDYNEVALRVQSIPVDSNDPGTNYYYSISTYVQWQGQGVSALIPNEDLGSGQWVHLVGTYDGVNWNLYRNGVLLGSAADTSGAGAVLVNKGNWAVGAQGRYAHMDALTPVLGRVFQGRIDEPAIYNTALSADQVLSHYTVGMNGLRLAISRSDTGVTLTWPAGTLQQADTVNGTYTDVSGATSPYTIPASGAKFYRLRM